VAAVGRQLEVLPPVAMQALVATSIVSITLNPILFRWTQSLSGSPRSRSRDAIASEFDGRHRAIVVGYGPVGRTVTRLLRENDIDPCVVELNHDTVEALRGEGTRVVYGDAAHRETLEQAGIARATTLIFAASGSPADSIVRLAKEMNPALKILARSAYLRDVGPARAAGADLVVAAEAEVAIAMTEHILTELGATSEQLDRARARVRDEIATT